MSTGAGQVQGKAVADAISPPVVVSFAGAYFTDYEAPTLLSSGLVQDLPRRFA